jgi:hypothetical protein
MMAEKPKQKEKDVFEKKPKATKTTAKPKKGEEGEERLHDDLEIKKGGLRNSLKVDKDYKFTKSKLRPLLKHEEGKAFDFEGKRIKMTEKIRKQIQLAINLMK